MIRDQQRPWDNMRKIGLNFDAQCIEQSDGPTLLEQQAATVAADAEQGQRNNGPANDQQGQAKNPKCADDGRGLVQASCPR